MAYYYLSGEGNHVFPFVYCRAVQNIMFEGKIRRRELILELQHADVVLTIKDKKDKEREADLMLIHRWGLQYA